MINVTDIHKSYSGQEVLKAVSINFLEGKNTAILGPNGSGKTTLIKSILGLVIPEKGAIKIKNQVINGNYKYRENIGYLPQIARFPENLKVIEFINMVKDLRGKQAFENELIDYFGLTSFLDKRLRNLSGGTRQKVNIVIAFMFQPDVYILDEPTVGLDPVSLLKFKDMLKEKKSMGNTIIHTTHIVDIVEEYADEVIFMLEGKIYFNGKISELKDKFGEEKLDRAIAKIQETEYCV